ncbi:MAG TPA: CoA-binding protein [Planctomycetes bacterium]|nr:CoA-binding protein [Planctomycetota bacterium]
MTWSNPDDEALRDLLAATRTIALIGASPKPSRPSHGVMRYLQQAGYEVIPVRPGGGEVLGAPCVDSLGDLSEAPDLVDVFRAPEHVPEIVEEAIACGAKALWLQDGVIHLEAAQRARAAGLTVVMDDCTLRVHRRLLPRG